VITLHINGASQVFDQGLNVTELIQHLALVGRKLAIERNGELVPRSQYAECHVVDGDRLEIVVAVGGG
jgi:sulfur carrier protein